MEVQSFWSTPDHWAEKVRSGQTVLPFFVWKTSLCKDPGCGLPARGNRGMSLY